MSISRAMTAACGLSVLCALPAGAQIGSSLTVRADNDAFNFWVEPGRRPDRDYTSGVALRYDGGRVPWWARRLGRDAPACHKASAHDAACRMRLVELGQQIFTPERTRDAATPPPGSRPNAGWLFIRDGARVLRERSQREVSITLGVTGPPALAKQTQQLFHSLAPGFNRPIDWREQLAFEPGVIVGASQTMHIPSGRIGSLGFDVLPRVVLQAGTVNTSAELGARARAGYRLRHPWLARADRGTEIVIAVGASTSYVARDLFLDGNTFVESARVGHEPFVHRYDWSASIRRGPLTVSWGAVTQTRAYDGGPGHTWARLSVSLQPVTASDSQ